MDELVFNCPDYLAQRFWLMCAKRKRTPGDVLREFMTNEIRKVDKDFVAENQTA